MLSAMRWRMTVRPAIWRISVNPGIIMGNETMYSQVILQCVQMLKNLERWLDEAQRYAATKKFDVGILMNGRLSPDMRPFIYQVQSACDYVKGGVAWLSGQIPPTHEDNEQTIDEVRERIRKTVSFAESVNEIQYEGGAPEEFACRGRPTARSSADRTIFYR